MLDRVGGLLGRVGEIVRSCHERWDGRGYPDGLAGEEIPLAARIVFACDAYNAMTTDRPYREAMPREARSPSCRPTRAPSSIRRIVAALIKVVEQRRARDARDHRRGPCCSRRALPVAAERRGRHG